MERRIAVDEFWFHVSFEYIARVSGRYSGPPESCYEDDPERIEDLTLISVSEYQEDGSWKLVTPVRSKFLFWRFRLSIEAECIEVGRQQIDDWKIDQYEAYHDQ